MKHPDKIKSRINKLRQLLPELRSNLKKSDYEDATPTDRELHIVRLHSAEASIESLKWVLEEGEE